RGCHPASRNPRPRSRGGRRAGVPLRRRARAACSSPSHRPARTPPAVRPATRAAPAPSGADCRARALRAAPRSSWPGRARYRAALRVPPPPPPARVLDLRLVVRRDPCGHPARLILVREQPRGAPEHTLQPVPQPARAVEVKHVGQLVRGHEPEPTVEEQEPVVTRG